jgi:glycosyltransferase involved in cell wall biosynthesis
MELDICFLMDQVAGHITNYRNLRRVTETDREIVPHWREISYYRPDGRLERWRERYARFVPTYVTGNVRAAWEISGGLRAERYDAIFSNARVGVFFSRRLARTPTMIDFDATPRQLDLMESYTSRRDPQAVERLKWHLCHRMFHAAAVLQAWSNWAKRSAVDDYGVPEDKIVVNPPGVDLDQWRPTSPDESGDPVRVLFVGGDFRRKGGELLLSWLEDTADDVELHVVTREPVPSRPNLYVYHGLEPNSEPLLALYRQADLFVLPSLGECFGIATVEAMAAGLPVIGSDVGGTADIIEEGRNGFITRAGDAAALALAIDAMVGDATMRRRFGVRSRQLAEQRFDVAANARQTLGQLKQLASGGR